jgi:hypothetical protein
VAEVGVKDGQVLDALWEASADVSDFIGQSEGGQAVVSSVLPKIRLPGNGHRIGQTAEDLGKALRDQDLFERDGIVLMVNRRGRLSVMTSEKFHSWIEDYVSPYKLGERGEEAASMSDKCAAGVLASEQFIRELRPIRRVATVRLPVIRKDGTLELLPEGYDAETQVLTRSEMELQDDMSLDQAKAVFDQWMVDFPWPINEPEAVRSRAVALAAMFAPYLDLMLAPREPRPAFIFSANSEGAGKTLLCRLAVCPVFGPMRITAPPEGSDSEELTKALNAAAISGEPYLVFDNWRGEIKSSSLEAFITANVWGGRVLGQSRNFEVEKSCLIYVTANTARVNADMRRRCLQLSLHVQEAKIEERKYSRAISEEDILAARPQLLGALWAFVKHWDDQGRTPGSVNHSSFPRWSAQVGGIVQLVTGIHPCTAPLVSADDTLADMEKLVGAVMVDESQPLLEFRPAELMTKSREMGLFSWVLDEDPSEDDRQVRRERSAFGKILARFDGRTFGLKRLEVKGEGHARMIQIHHVEHHVADHANSQPAPA